MNWWFLSLFPIRQPHSFFDWSIFWQVDQCIFHIDYGSHFFWSENLILFFSDQRLLSFFSQLDYPPYLFLINNLIFLLTNQSVGSTNILLLLIVNLNFFQFFNNCISWLMSPLFTQIIWQFCSYFSTFLRPENLFFFFFVCKLLP